MSEDEDDVNKDQNYVIEVKDGNFSWDLGKQELCLKNINIAVPQGEIFLNIYSWHVFVIKTHLPLEDFKISDLANWTNPLIVAAASA